MADVWYGPDEQWPRHPKPYFRDALEVVRAAGWHYKKLQGHSEAWVYCRRPVENQKHCRFLVMSTATGGESAARTLRGLPHKCRHVVATLPVTSDVLAEVTGLVAGAERLAAAGDRMLEAEERGERARMMLDALSTTVEEADQVLSNWIEADDEAGNLHRQADELARSTGYEGLLRPAEVAAEADRKALAAQRRLDDQQDPEAARTAKTLRRRIRELRGRIQSLRQRVNSGDVQ